MPPARVVEVADRRESVGPVAGDRHDIRPCLAGHFPSGLGGGAGLGSGLLVEGQTGIGAACIPQRIGEVAEAGPARLALRCGVGGQLQVREEFRQQIGIVDAGDQSAGEVTQPLPGPGLDAIDQGAAAGLEVHAHVLVLQFVEHRLQPLGIGETEDVFRQVVPVLRMVQHPSADARADQLVAGEVGIGIVRPGALLGDQPHGRSSGAGSGWAGAGGRASSWARSSGGRAFSFSCSSSVAPAGAGAIAPALVLSAGVAPARGFPHSTRPAAV